jgi:hypothetical protein
MCDLRLNAYITASGQEVRVVVLSQEGLLWDEVKRVHELNGCVEVRYSNEEAM